MAIKTSGRYKGGLPVEVHSHERPHIGGPHIGGPLGDKINSASPAELKKFRSDLAKMDKQGRNVVAVRTPTGKPVLEISPKIVMQHVDARIGQAKEIARLGYEPSSSRGPTLAAGVVQLARAAASNSKDAKKVQDKGGKVWNPDQTVTYARDLRGRAALNQRHAASSARMAVAAGHGSIVTGAKGGRYYVSPSGQKTYIGKLK